MKKYISNQLRKYLTEGTKETLEQFYVRFKETNPNPNFLENHFKNPNFMLRMTQDGGVKTKEYSNGMANKCETNTFNFIRSMVRLDNHKYFPVSGWGFLNSTTFFEHFWVYDSMNDVFIDVTPMKGDLPYAYGGVINKDINDEIINAEKYNDIGFLLGKTGESLYCDFSDNEPSPKLTPFKGVEQSPFDYINSNEKYRDLSELIKQNNITTLDELNKVLPKLSDLQMNTRNNRDYEYYGKLIQQIKHLDI